MLTKRRKSQTIISTAIPKITDEFHSLEDIGWYGSAFFVTTAATQASWGRLYTFFPLKWTYLISIGFFELGSVVCGTLLSLPSRPPPLSSNGKY